MSAGLLGVCPISKSKPPPCEMQGNHSKERAMRDENAENKSLFNGEVRIKGKVSSFEKLTSKAGKPYAVLVLDHIDKSFGEERLEKFTISVFAKTLEGQAAKIMEGDEIEVVCRLKSEEFKERWYMKLSLKDVKFLQIGERNKTQNTESGTREVSAPPVEEDANLPF